MRRFPRLSFAIDRGGTFTDVVALVTAESGETQTDTCKLLSVDPDHYKDAPSEGIRRILVRHTSAETLPGSLIPTSHIDEVRMGTTVATNALLEHNGIPCAVAVTEGLDDILYIGTQARPEIFALNVKKNTPLPQQTIGIKERVRVIAEGEVACATEERRMHWKPTSGGLWIEVIQQIDEAQVEDQLKRVFESGIQSVGICLMHAYAFPDHERIVAEIARRVGFTNVSISSELCPMIKYVSRTTTTSVDSYVTPLISQYVQGFKSHFEQQLSGVRLLFIQSDGGMTAAETFYGYKAVLSGPAGGVVGCATTTTAQLGDVQIVGFDMGGTSTDVSRCDGIRINHTMEAQIGGTLVQSPQVEVHTVAAGGGSILKWENSMFVVGPESAGAFPGPACYGRGGPLTVTDANLLLGRLNPELFPKIFGPGSNEPLNSHIVTEKFTQLARIINRDRRSTVLSVADIALSFVVVANETMCRPIRNLTEAKGYRADQHVLSVFGGAGGQHACGVANALGIARIFIHKLSSFMSAVGIQRTDVVEDGMQACSLGLDVDGAYVAQVAEIADRLSNAAVCKLEAEYGFHRSQIVTERKLNLRFEGTSTAIMTELTPNVLDEFTANYRRQFGFVLTKRRVLIDDVWVRARGVTSLSHESKLNDVKDYLTDLSIEDANERITKSFTKVYFDGAWQETPNYKISGCPLSPCRVCGPAVLVGDGATIVVEPHVTAFITSNGSVVMHSGKKVEQISEELKPLPLSIFSHRFMSIAEQMGFTLQRTAISTNIKERLDFSCAVFDPDGSLVANAPHIPVHLGAMGAAIRWQREHHTTDWHEGDVFLSNHPSAGGSHLPDITVISACFHEGSVLFYVASRGHHADVGGTTPGSMPPFSKHLDEEGAAIKTLKLVAGGVFDEEAARAALMAPASRPGMEGCRTIDDSISDLKAQVAANHKGVELVQSLVCEFGLNVVQAYMKHIQAAGEGAARQALRKVAAEYGSDISAEDFMDDGTPIRLKVSIDPTLGSAIFDFRESGGQVLSSTNCPTAVVHSAVIYCIRCLVGSDIPLNQGCLRPVTILVRPGSILAPDEDCAVVAGNVLTSQRVTDVIFTALRAVACSQGCMNNVTFGNRNFAYYETICGGTGAGPTFDGAPCVQSHMTNTRITDPEILERRYPVLLQRFAVRTGSGGCGRFRGGDGCIRTIYFLEAVTLSVLSERRSLPPRGAEGGGDGHRGLNLLYFPASSGLSLAAHWKALQSLPLDGNNTYRQKNISGKNTLMIQPGQVLQIRTPGGGGFGK